MSASCPVSEAGDLKKKLGYSTAVVGKWHLFREPKAFDNYKVLPVRGKYINLIFREKVQGPRPKHTVKTQGHASDVITRITIVRNKSYER